MTSVKKGKEKICKCGHLLEPYHHKHSKFLGMKTTSSIPCTECKCFYYVARDYPDMNEKICVGILVVGIALLIGLIGFLIYVVSDNYQHLLIKDTDHLLSKTFLTYHQVFKIIPIVLVFVILFLANFGYGFYMDYHRRKNTELISLDDTTDKESRS